MVSQQVRPLVGCIYTIGALTSLDKFPLVENRYVKGTHGDHHDGGDVDAAALEGTPQFPLGLTQQLWLQHVS